MSRWRSLLPWLIFLVVLTVYCKSRVTSSFDSGYSIHLALSLLREGNLDLEEYRDVIRADDYRVMEVDGVLQSRYPVGPSVVAVPLVEAIRIFAKQALYVRDLDAFIRANSPGGIEKFIASFFTALAAVLIFHVARLRLSPGLSLLVVFIFAFCTSAWSVVSRALWQHAPSMLFLSAALYVLLRARDQPRMSQYAGLFLGLAFAMRPTNALVVALATIYVVTTHRAWTWRYLGWVALVILPLVTFHLATLGTPFPWYYLQAQGRFGLFHLSFLEAAAGTLVSPGRGLFVYSPVFLFSLLGIALSLRQRPRSRLDGCLAVILLLHWIVISSWQNWWGGAVFGPRLFADMIPFFIYFLIPVVEQLRSSSFRRHVLAVGLAVAIAASFLVHRAGACDGFTWNWNLKPVHIDEDPSRLWDWSDPPFLRRKGGRHSPGSPSGRRTAPTSPGGSPGVESSIS